MTDDETAYNNRPSRESASICMAICLACMLVLGVISGVLSWIK